MFIIIIIITVSSVVKCSFGIIMFIPTNPAMHSRRPSCRSEYSI